MPNLRHGSLFTGIGGIDLGMEWAGIETAFQVEINPFCLKVLEARWPGVQRFRDVRSVGKHNLPAVDVLSGGFPCQDISQAGRKRGLGTAEQPTERSGLWFEFHRIIGEIRPRWVLIENVSRLRNHGADRVIDDMEGTGYACWPQVVDAEALGAPHKRDRTFILCRDNAHCDGDSGEHLGGGQPLLPTVVRQVEEARKEWDFWKHELGAGDDGQDGGARPAVAAAYAAGVRAVHGIPEWPHRLRACGNAVVPQIPALIGSFIVQWELHSGRQRGLLTRP